MEGGRGGGRRARGASRGMAVGTLEGPRGESRSEAGNGAHLDSLGQQVLTQDAHVLVSDGGELPPTKRRYCQMLHPCLGGWAIQRGPR
eukprot:2382232-Pyramimonas_sp.AAC.1